MQSYGAIAGKDIAVAEAYVTRLAANWKAVSDDIEVMSMEVEDDTNVIT